MKKDQAKKRQVFIMVLFVLVLLFLYWLNTQSATSKDLPEVFITRESTEESKTSTSTIDLETGLSTIDGEAESQSSSEGDVITSYNGEQDVAARFAATYLCFTPDSKEEIQSMIEPALSSKLEQLEQEEQEIDSLSLLDKSTLEEKNIYVYEFKATLKDKEKTKKNGKIFVIMKPQTGEKDISVVSDVEWTYET